MPSPPIIATLPSLRTLIYDHHGPSSDGAVKLGQTDQPPTSFHNPWSSWRMASAADLWRSYQMGAAIAEPQPAFSASVSRTPSRQDTLDNGVSKGTPSADYNHGQHRHAAAGQLFSDPADEDNEDDECCSEYDEDEFPHPEHCVHPDEKVAGYIPEKFRRVDEEDTADDWREPPIIVRRPEWLKVDVPTFTWLGHAGALVRFPMQQGKGMAGIVFDPMFSYRCSPTQLVGPARSLDPPCAVEELPTIYACCISHDHYDHLDYNTILELWATQQSTIHFFVPLGCKAWFKSCGIPEQRITELDWWHEALLTIPSGSATPPLGYPPNPTARIDPDAALTLKIAFTPAQHRSGRGLMDQFATLWGSWVVGVVTPAIGDRALEHGMSSWPEDAYRMYFGGDTGYRYATAAEDGDMSAICPAFQQIADTYGPMTAALLPLSTGSSLPFLRKLLSLSLDQYTLTSSQHCSPADSIDIHNILRAKRSVGMHWGTFCDAAEARATRVEFGRARRNKNVSDDLTKPNENGAFIVVDIGESVALA